MSLLATLAFIVGLTLFATGVILYRVSGRRDYPNRLLQYAQTRTWTSAMFFAGFAIMAPWLWQIPSTMDDGEEISAFIYIGVIAALLLCLECFLESVVSLLRCRREVNR